MFAAWCDARRESFLSERRDTAAAYIEDERARLKPSSLNRCLAAIHIAPNAFRRIKNPQLLRNLAIHSDIFCSGFLDYLKAVRMLCYQRLIPNIYSLATRSPRGDRLYALFALWRSRFAGWRDACDFIRF